MTVGELKKFLGPIRDHAKVLLVNLENDTFTSLNNAGTDCDNLNDDGTISTNYTWVREVWLAGEIPWLDIPEQEY